MKKVNEKFISKKLYKDFTQLGYIVVKNTVSSISGFPDRTILKNGLTFFIETKTTGDKLTPLQLHVHGLLRDQGFLVFVVDNYESLGLAKNSIIKWTKKLSDTIVTSISLPSDAGQTKRQ